MSRSRPSRSTVFATSLVTLFFCLGVGFGLYFVGSAAVSAIRGSYHEVSIHQELDVDELASLPPTTATDRVTVTTIVMDADAKQTWYSVGRDVVPMVLAIGILWLLQGILYSVRDGDPFTQVNVRRLRLIGLVLLIGVPVAELARSAFEQALVSSVKAPGSGLSFSLPGDAILAGLGVFVLAQVFAHGVRLREDAEGTV